MPQNGDFQKPFSVDLFDYLFIFIWLKSTYRVDNVHFNKAISISTGTKYSFVTQL